MVQLQKLTLRHKNGLYLYRSKNMKVTINIQWTFVIFYFLKFQAKRKIPQCCSFIIGYVIVKTAKKLSETNCTREQQNL